MRKILYFLCFLITVIIVYFIVDFSIPTKGVNLNTGVENDFVIAHAGGAIEGFNYTNSLEALNHAYDQGVRLFEMDILETSDGKLIAAHTWKDFKEMINYKGEIDESPLTEEEFINSKIHNKFTPMNMDRINEWFKNHPDAILITDKINEPLKIADPQIGFHYKERCIMELFSINAIKQAIESGITPMANQQLLIPNSKYKVAKLYRNYYTYLYSLKKMNVRYLAVSHKMIKGNERFFKTALKQGFLIYVFHVNLPEDINESFIYNNYMDYITGMYADDLNFY